MKTKYPSVDSMISGTKGVVVSVVKASPKSILIELYDSLKEEKQGEPNFLDRCIAFAANEVEIAIRNFAAGR